MDSLDFLSASLELLIEHCSQFLSKAKTGTPAYYVLIGRRSAFYRVLSMINELKNDL